MVSQKIRLRAKSSYPLDTGLNEGIVNSRLPDGFRYEDGMLYFPAGEITSYLVNYRDYNFNFDFKSEDPRNQVVSDLVSDGFTPSEAEQYVDLLKEIDEETKFLEWEQSQKWLRLHPEYLDKAKQILNNTIKEIRSEKEA